MKITLAQINTRLLDIQHNINLHVEVLNSVSKDEKQLVVFPELSVSGYTVQDGAFDLALMLDDVLLNPLKEKSISGNSFLFGMPERGVNGEIFNSAILSENGKLSVAHRKRYLPTYNVFDESRFFTRGNLVRAIETNIGKIGVLICEDSWHPGLAYLLAYQKIDILIIMAASPYRSTIKGENLDIQSKWHVICQSYSATYSIPVVCVNRVGSEDGVLFWGGSSAFKPGGYLEQQLSTFDSEIKTITFDKSDGLRDRYLSTHFFDEDLIWQLHQMEDLVKNIS